MLEVLRYIAPNRYWLNAPIWHQDIIKRHDLHSKCLYQHISSNTSFKLHTCSNAECLDKDVKCQLSVAQNAFKKGVHLTHVFTKLMSSITSQFTGKSTVCSTICLGEHGGKHQSPRYWPCASGIHQWPMGSPHKGPVTRKAFPYDDVLRRDLCFTLYFNSLFL